MDILTYFFITSATLGLPPDLLPALCYVETNHRVHAIHYHDGNGNSYGICQIKYKSAVQMGFKGTRKELMEPKTNIYYAGKFLKHQINRYHSTKRGVIAYNRGNAKGLTTSQYQVKVYNKWREINEGQRSISSAY